jgi:hypothetical protein
LQVEDCGAKYSHYWKKKTHQYKIFIIPAKFFSEGEWNKDFFLDWNS